MIKNQPTKDEMQVQFPWRRERLCTPVFLPEKSHGQWSLVGYSPQGCKRHDLVTKQQQQKLKYNAYSYFAV